MRTRFISWEDMVDTATPELPSAICTPLISRLNNGTRSCQTLEHHSQMAVEATVSLHSTERSTFMVDGIQTSNTTTSGNSILKRTNGLSQISTSESQDGTILPLLCQLSQPGNSSSSVESSSSSMKVLPEDSVTIPIPALTWTWEPSNGPLTPLTQRSSPTCHHQESMPQWPTIAASQDSSSTEDGTTAGSMTFTPSMWARLLDHHMPSPTPSHNLDKSLEAPS